MAEQVFYAKINLQDPESSRVKDTTKPAVSCPWKYKCLIIGLSVMSLILLTSSVSMGIMMYNTEGLQKDLDLCSTERHSLNLSLSQSQDSEQKLTHRLQHSSLILTCLTQQIRDAEKCPPGWISIDGQCYFFSEERKTRVESEAFCYRNKAQLATVKPRNTTIQLRIKSRNSEYWIGLIEQNRPSPGWYWPDGTTELSLGSIKPGLCATMGGSLGVIACDVKHKWICEKAKDKSYLIDRINECNI